MKAKEHLIVPTLGVVVILTTFILGVPIVYKVLIGLLGLAAVGTYFAPRAVQIETRIAIAGAGLVILLLVSSTAFWLALLSFGAIAALQIQHLGTLQRNLATVTWLDGLVKAAKARRAGQTPGGEGGDAGTVGEGAASQGGQVVASWHDSVPGFVRLNVSGVGGAILGALALFAIFQPWTLVVADTAWGETVSVSVTMQEAAADVQLGALNWFFPALIVLAVAGIATIGLPRIFAAGIGIAGAAVAVAAYLYIVGQFGEAEQAIAEEGASAFPFPHRGSILAVLCYLGIILLQAIPAWNRKRRQWALTVPASHLATD